MGTNAARGREQLLPGRVVNDAVLHAAVDLDADRNAKDRKAVQEIGRAVQRINDPDDVRFATGTRFLGEDGVLGVVPANGLDDRSLGRTVRFTDEVVVTLGLDPDGVELGNLSHQQIARTACGHDRHVQ